jgi:DNA polymerase-3 subunit delta
MVALKDAALARFLATPDITAGAALVFGSDDGLIAERARQIARAATGIGANDLNLIRLEAESIAADPGRLADAVLSLSMFGGRRVVWVRELGGRNLAPLIAPLLDQIDGETFLVVEAGDLKKGAPLRALFEEHRRAVAIICYPDDTRSLGEMIETEARAHQLTISRESVALLTGLLGSDRLVSRAEVQKLCLYCRGSGTITSADIEAILGDVSGFALDQLIDAVASGDLTATERSIARMGELGMPASVIASQAERHFLLLQRLRAEVDVGKRAADLVERAQPTIYFKRRAAVAAQITSWSPAALNRALDLIHIATAKARLAGSGLEPVIVSEAFLTLARGAAAMKRRA